MTEGAWTTDVLGAPFQQLTLPLGSDDEGDVVATLVRLLPEAPGWRTVWQERRPFADVDVLYVHGWSDYFFQQRLARYWADRGARFFALDLRKYGRSIRDGQTPGYVTDLETYDEDIAAALDAIRAGQRRPRRLVLLGHSTGGLILSLWANRHPGAAAAVILNSPWLEFQFPGIARAAIAPFVELTARWRPMDRAPQVDLGFYARAQREVAVADEPVDVNVLWRPEHAMLVHAGWLRAILAGHDAVGQGLHVAAPVCVLLSTRSSMPTRWSDDLLRTDSVLVVDDIANAALRLGASVTVERIDGALHDVFLSAHDARAEAYARLDRWATAMLARRSHAA